MKKGVVHTALLMMDHTFTLYLYVNSTVCFCAYILQLVVMAPERVISSLVSTVPTTTQHTDSNLITKTVELFNILDKSVEL